MYQSVNLNGFISAFNEFRGGNFTPEALELIYEFLVSYEDETNMEVELDVIAICCDFNEMTHSEVAEAFSIPKNDTNSIVDFLENKTLFLGLTSSDTYVFQSF